MRGGSSSLLSRLALWAIRLYQRRLSPIKGYSCAYRVATGGRSCSAYGYRAIARHGLAAGLALLDRRLTRCGELHRARVSSSGPARNPLLHYQRGDCDCGGCDIGDLGGCGCDGGCGGPREHPGRRCEPFQRWREQRWMAKAARLQRERMERETRERIERERRERERNARGPGR
jgi:putative component of membrane protein insertase Oxa1/YidC/SpoIIIJ protein YidD